MKHTILLLGGWGFIGTNILKFVDRELHTDYEFIVFDKLDTHPHGVNFDCVRKVYSGDFFDDKLIESIFVENKIDSVIHLISTTVPALCFNARYDIESNLIPTIQLLDLLVKYKVYDVSFVSSGGAVYGVSEFEIKHKESDNLYPISSYGVTKLTIEKYMMQYASLYGLRPLILRLSNPYGRYHYSLKQGLCNVALRAAMQNEIFQVWGDGSARKDYIFVEDFCEILFILKKKDIHTRVLNVASGEILSINQILSDIKHLFPSFTWEYKDASKFDVLHFELDTSELISSIGVFQFSSLKDVIKKL